MPEITGPNQIEYYPSETTETTMVKVPEGVPLPQLEETEAQDVVGEAERITEVAAAQSDQAEQARQNVDQAEETPVAPVPTQPEPAETAPTDAPQVAAHKRPWEFWKK